MVKSRRQLFEALARAVMPESGPARDAGPSTPPAVKESAPPAAQESAPRLPESDDEIEQRMIDLLTGGEQTRRNFLGRLGALVAGIVSSGPAGAMAAAASDSKIREAAVLYRAWGRAAASIDLLNQEMFSEPDMVSEVVFHGSGHVVDKVKFLNLDKLLDMGFLTGLDVRDKHSIEDFRTRYEEMANRYGEISGKMKKLEDFIRRQRPDEYFNDIIYPEHASRLKTNRVFMNREFGTHVSPREERPGRMREAAAEIMRKNTGFLRDYQKHYTEGTLEQWVEETQGKGAGSYERYKRSVEGADYSPAPRSAARTEQMHESIASLVGENGIRMEMEIGKAETPQRITLEAEGLVQGGVLQRVNNLIARLYPEIAHMEKTEKGNRLVVLDPPEALRETLLHAPLQHPLSIVATNQISGPTSGIER